MRNVIITLACVVCLSATTSAALAQSQLGAGSISGTVSDSNGAVIPAWHIAEVASRITASRSRQAGRPRCSACRA